MKRKYKRKLKRRYDGNRLGDVKIILNKAGREDIEGKFGTVKVKDKKDM